MLNYKQFLFTAFLLVLLILVSSSAFSYSLEENHNSSVKPIEGDSAYLKQSSAILGISDKDFSNYHQIHYLNGQAKKARFFVFRKNLQEPVSNISITLYQNTIELAKNEVPVSEQEVLLKRFFTLDDLKNTTEILVTSGTEIAIIRQTPSDTSIAQAFRTLNVTTEEQIQALASNPTISSISGFTGFGTYSGYACFDLLNNVQLIIKGTNFGTNRGFVDFQIGNFSASVSFWSNTEVRLNVKSTINANPGSFTFKLIRADQIPSNSVNIAVVPTILARQFGQSEWWTAKRRIETNRTPSNPNPYSSKLAANANTYEPQQFDVLMFGLNHQAFIENLSKSVVYGSNGMVDYRFTLYLSEYNAQRRENRNDYVCKIVIRQFRDGNRIFLTSSTYPDIQPYPRGFFAVAASSVWR